MEVNVSSLTKAPANTIPAHVLERMEAEWRQMRQPQAQTSASHAQK